MTFRILKSAIVDRQAFDIAVAAYAYDLKIWREHMRRVEEDEKNGVTGIKKHQPYPRPRYHSLIEEAVNENGQADYEVIDDGPTPEARLAAAKQKLFDQVVAAEHQAIAAIWPMGKRRLHLMHEADIQHQDSSRYAELRKADDERYEQECEAFIAKRKSLIAHALARAVTKTAEMLGLKEVEEIPTPSPRKSDDEIRTEVEQMRDDADTHHLGEQAERKRRVDRIQRAAAQALYDIEDLTLESIDRYQLPDLSSI